MTLGVHFVNGAGAGRTRGDRPGPVLQTLARGLDLLFLFSESRPTLTLAAIARALAVPRSTAYRLLRTLRSRGLVREDGSPGEYTLGWSALTLAQSAGAGLDLARVVYPAMAHLHARTGETVILAAPAGLQGVCLERIESRHGVRLSITKGTRMALHAGASAKAVLAFLPEEIRERVIREEGLPRLTPRTLVRPAALRAELARIRRQGYAVSRGELDPGAWAVAAPILASDGRLVAALSVAGPLTRFEERALPRLVRDVREAADEAARLLRVGGAAARGPARAPLVPGRSRPAGRPTSRARSRRPPLGVRAARARR